MVSTAAPPSTLLSTFPDESRGFYTSFIQITASLGLLISLAVVLGLQNAMSPQTFAADSFVAGWRIPFVLSLLLVVASLYIRLRMKVHSGAICNHGLRTNRCLSGGGLSSEDPVHVNVTSLPYWKWSVWWLTANGGTLCVCFTRAISTQGCITQ